MLIAACQMNSGPKKSDNIEQALALVRKARRRGAEFVALPENVFFMGPEADRHANAEPLDGPSFKAFATLAAELKITVLLGSGLEAGAPNGKLYNTSVLYSPDGVMLAVYRKIHLFDVEVGDGQKYFESEAVAAGADIVTAQTPVGCVGLSVCYDLRFPELYRTLVSKGATLLTVPSAFTLMTGKDHWEVLLRARAIENQCYVVAPAQQGKHGPTRLTYGHSLIVDPWGLVVARASEGVGLAMAEVDMSLLQRYRQEFPALQHRKLSI
jgi:deaminated glutathione amidase